MGLAFSGDFGIGTMDDNFQECGKTPVWMLELKIMAIGVAMLSAVSFSILPEILSGPEAFEVSMAFSIINTSCSVQRRLSGHSWLLLSILLVDSGGSFVLKQSAKKVFSTLALSKSSFI